MDTTSSATKMFSAIQSQQTLRSQAATTALSNGMALFQKKKYREAVSLFKQATAYSPDMVDAYNYMASAYLQQGNNTEAIKAYKISISIDRSQDSIHVNLGNIYMSQNKYSEAEKEFKAAISVNPGDNLAPYTLGQLYMKTERYSEAAAQFQKVMRMTPKDGNVYYALGEAFNKMGRFSEAIPQLEKALELKKNFALAQFELGTAFIGLERKDDAQSQIDILKNLNTSLANELERDLVSPKMFAFNSANSTFSPLLGSGTPLAFLDASLLAPNSSKDFTMQFQFDSEMDASSVMNIANWSITKASGGQAGYYNNGLTLYPQKQTTVSPLPKFVVYDPNKRQATLTFTIAQNADGTGVIDPSHLVFKFSGKDINGKSMDSSADQYDGFVNGFF